MIYTVTLNPALDYALGCADLRFGAINRAKSAVIRFGGKGLDVSAMLAHLGVPSVALGFSAGFTGRRLVELAEADGVTCDFTELAEGETRINIKLRPATATDADDPPAELDVNAPGPAVTEGDLDALAAKLAALGSGDILVVSGSVPASAPPDAYDRILAAAADRGAACAVDADGETLRSALRRRPLIVKPNHVELAALYGGSAEEPDKIAALAARMQRDGAQNVLVSRAENGAMLFTGDGAAYSVGVVRGALVDSACCGDAMLAGFLAAYSQTRDFAEALRLGAACGNATAFCDGIADAESVRAIYEKLTVESL